MNFLYSGQNLKKSGGGSKLPPFKNFTLAGVVGGEACVCSGMPHPSFFQNHGYFGEDDDETARTTRCNLNCSGSGCVDLNENTCGAFGQMCGSALIDASELHGPTPSPGVDDDDAEAITRSSFPDRSA